MSDIFFSYATHDHELVRPIVQVLKSEGWTVFWDREIPSGRVWRDMITEELARASCVVVAWSRASIKSYWVAEECEIARGRKLLVPLRVENVLPPLGFQSLQAADLSNWDGSEDAPQIKDLIREVRRRLEANRAAAAESAEAPDGEAPASDEGSAPPATALEYSLKRRWQTRGNVFAGAFSPDGRHLVVSGPGTTFTILDPMTFDEQCVATPHHGPIRALAFHQRRAWLASAAADRTILVWNFFQRSVREQLVGHDTAIMTLAFDPDSDLLASADASDTIRIWDTRDGSCLKTWKADHGMIYSLAFVEPGVVSSAGAGRGIRLWDIASVTLKRTIPTAICPLYAHCASPSAGILAAAGRGVRVSLWETGPDWRIQTMDGRHDRSVLSLVFSSDGSLLMSGAADGKIGIWDLSRRKLTKTLCAGSGAVQFIAGCGHGDLLASATSEGSITLWQRQIPRPSPRFL